MYTFILLSFLCVLLSLKEAHTSFMLYRPQPDREPTQCNSECGPMIVYEYRAKSMEIIASNCDVTVSCTVDQSDDTVGIDVPSLSYAVNTSGIHSDTGNIGYPVRATFGCNPLTSVWELKQGSRVSIQSSIRPLPLACERQQIEPARDEETTALPTIETTMNSSEGKDSSSSEEAKSSRSRSKSRGNSSESKSSSENSSESMSSWENSSESMYNSSESMSSWGNSSESMSSWGNSSESMYNSSESMSSWGNSSESMSSWGNSSESMSSFEIMNETSSDIGSGFSGSGGSDILGIDEDKGGEQIEGIDQS